jgi:hypothetical protein
MINGQHNCKTDDSIMQHPKTIAVYQVLSHLKAALVNSGFLLGNVLLLLGGDDSVEIVMNSRSCKVLDKSAIPLLSNKNNEGQNA